MQLAKLGLAHVNPAYNLESLDEAVGRLDREHPQALRWAQDLISCTPAAGRLSMALATHAADLLNISPSMLISEGGRWVPSLPGSTRRLYTWHSEASWLPLRRKFVNCWCPLGRAKIPDCGTVYLIPGSHQREPWPFVEFKGFDDNTLEQDNHYTQYQVPEEVIGPYLEKGISAHPGDILFFDRNLLHRSEINASSHATYIWVERFFDLRQDLTLSSNINLRAYSEEALHAGHPHLRPITEA